MNATLQQENPQTADRPAEFITPQVSIYETREEYVVEAEMPGVSKQGLEITLEGNEIMIVGRRTEESIPGKALFRESRIASYRRVFQLDPAIDTTKIGALMEQGVLRLTLPKSESVKPRRIQVD